MDKWVGFEVVASCRTDDYKAWWEARDKRIEELGGSKLLSPQGGVRDGQ